MMSLIMLYSLGWDKGWKLLNSLAGNTRKFTHSSSDPIKAIITGDVTQIDLPPQDSSGLIEATRILKNVDGIDFVFFDENDVVRHRLVKDIIKAYGKNDKVSKK